ncbi:MAG: hypothetical protein ACRDHW_09805, partial [Ktedonobacteraceae bacterium]
MSADISEKETIETPAVHRDTFEEASFRRLREYFELCLLGAGICAMLIWLPVRYFFDGTARFNALLALIQHGVISPVSYSMVGPLFSLMLWPLDRLFPLFGETNWWQERYNIFLLAAVFALTYVILCRRMDAALLRKFFLIILVGSMFGNNVTFFAGETFTALLVGMGILVALLAWEVIGWFVVVLGVVNTPATLVGLSLVTLNHIIQKKRVRYCLMVIAAGLLIAAESWIRRGNPLNGGYENQTFSTPFLLGLISILFSFGKGILFFAPALLLPVKNFLKDTGEKFQTLYHAYKLWMLFVVGLVLVYSSWWAWYGGWSWGPRFFLFASIPASFALAVRLRYQSRSIFANLLTLLFLGYSLWVGIDGAIFDQSDLANTCTVHNYAQEYLCHYNPLYSALWRPFEVHSSLTHKDIF